MNIDYEKVRQRIRLKEIPEVIRMNRAYKYGLLPTGIVILSGEQGSGKSLVATSFVRKMVKDNPDTVVITNTDMDGAIPYKGIKTILDTYEKHAGSQIVLYIDEITSEFNSLDSKEFNTDWFTIINMMRKRNILIVGTCPLFTRLSKAFREQFDSWFVCTKGFLGLCIRLDLYKNVFDGSDVSDDTINANGCQYIKRYRHWIYSEDYKSYDTRAIIKTYRKDVKK